MGIFSNQRLLTGLVTNVAILATGTAAVEAASFVSNRIDLNANDQLDWVDLFNPGPPTGPGPSLSLLPNDGFPATTERGLDLTVDISSDGIDFDLDGPGPDTGVTPPFIFQTTAGAPPANVPTNFAPGDYILFTGLTPGAFPSPGNDNPISILFDEPVLAAGAQFAVDDALTPYTATIEAFDIDGMLLASFSVDDATSSIALDNSAVFLGVESDVAEIARIDFFSDLPGLASGINLLSVKTTPEPFGLIGLGLVTFGILRSRRKN
ncbi:MAG: hypothetical protein AAGG02_14805 [Cyanobacteria bacterium P01_H01_bin.15]